MPEKRYVVTTPVSVTCYREVFQAVLERPPERALTIACANVHSVMSAARSETLSEALRSADIVTPDGMPLVWALGLIHDEPIRERVYGPDLMLHVLDWGCAHELRHYFFGSTEATLESMSRKLQSRFPGAQLVGFESPPFRPLSEAELIATAERIRSTRADVVWLGLGMPKQELLMKRIAPLLPGIAIAGVGAAFDFAAGTVRQAPKWLQDRGAEWAFRLVQEPRRLYKRYLFNNPAYLLWLGYACGRKFIRNRSR